MGRYAEAIAEENHETSPRPRDTQKQRLSDLTEEEVKLLNEKKTDIYKLVAERRRLKDQAESELNRMVTADPNRESLITTKEYKNLRDELRRTESPAKTKEILEKIRQLAQSKEREKGILATDNKRLSPEDPRLLELEDKFNEICDENEHLIGTKQIPGFKAWFARERRQNPTIGHLKEQIRKLEGKEIMDRNGLSPRREEYKLLQALFKRYNLGEPTECKWIEEEGLSERKKFRQNAETMEQHLSHQKDTGFYSKEMIIKTMGTILTADNPQVQERLIGKARKTARRESESYIYLDNKIDVGGKSIRKMSEKSKKKLIDYYKNETDFDERDKTNFKQMVENEGQLAKDLEKIYGDDKKGLNLAMEKFQNLDFVEKQAALKEHESLVKEKIDKDTRHKELILDAAGAAIDDAEKENTISEKTAERYRKLFEDENNYKNPETGKPGDIKVLEKMHGILTNPMPQENYKNLAAYKNRRDNFAKDLERLREADPEMEEKEINEWQEKYDTEGWSKRALLHEKLKQEILKKEMGARKHRENEKDAKIHEKDKKEAKEFKKEKSEIIEAATIHMSENNPREALKLLLLYDEQNPDDKQILFLIEMAAKQLREAGNRKEADKTFEREMEEELADVAEETQNKKDLEEANIINLNIVGAKQSEQRHDKQKEAAIRAEDESLERLPGNSTEEDLVESYYEQTEDGYILNKDETGEEIQQVEFDDVAWTDQERHAAKEKLYHDQDRIEHKEGLLTQFTDKNGRIITAEEAQRREEEDLEEISDGLAEEAYERMEKKQAAEIPQGSIIEMQRQIAAKRKARQFVDRKVNERIKDAA